MKGCAAFCLIVLLVGVVPAAAMELELNPMRFRDGSSGDIVYGGEIIVHVSADDVQLKAPFDADFESMENDGDEWFSYSDEPMTLGDLQDAITGGWELRVVAGSNTYDYVFTVADVQEEDFLPVPSVTAPTWGETTGTDYSFQWDNNGADVDADGFVAWVEVADWERENGWMADGSGGTLGQDAEAWSVYGMPEGEAEFGVGYGVFAGLISEMTASTGAPDIDYWSAVISGDAVEFTVVPEPVTLSMLGLGALALLRRRR